MSAVSHITKLIIVELSLENAEFMQWNLAKRLTLNMDTGHRFYNKSIAIREWVWCLVGKWITSHLFNLVTAIECDILIILMLENAEYAVEFG